MGTGWEISLNPGNCSDPAFPLISDSAVSLRRSPGSLKGQINVTPGETKTSPWSLLFVSTMEQRGRTMAFQLLKN